MQITLDVEEYEVLSALNVRNTRAYDSEGMPWPAFPGDVAVGKHIWMVPAEAAGYVEKDVLKPVGSEPKKKKKGA